MLHWETAYEKQPCPHCGSKSTQVMFVFLSLIRYSCSDCKQSFDLKVSPPAPTK